MGLETKVVLCRGVIRFWEGQLFSHSAMEFWYNQVVVGIDLVYLTALPTLWRDCFRPNGLEQLNKDHQNTEFHKRHPTGNCLCLCVVITCLTFSCVGSLGFALSQAPKLGFFYRRHQAEDLCCRLFDGCPCLIF